MSIYEFPCRVKKCQNKKANGRCYFVVGMLPEKKGQLDCEDYIAHKGETTLLIQRTSVANSCFECRYLMGDDCGMWGLFQEHGNTPVELMGITCASFQMRPELLKLKEVADVAQRDARLVG